MSTTNTVISPLLDLHNAFATTFEDCRVALFHDYRYSHGVGAYIQRVLQQLCNVEVFFPHEAQQIGHAQAFDLYIAIDDSTHYVFPPHLRPSAFWVVDTHLSFSFDVVMAMGFDYIFCAQKDGARKLMHHGFTNVFWLPLACDPDLHYAGVQPKYYDIGFVGNYGTGQRRVLLEEMKRRYPTSFIGRALHEEMAMIYANSKVVANVSIRNDINMRVFEGLCSGTALLTSRVEGMDDLFVDGRDLFLYESPQQLWDRLDYLLGAEGEAKREDVALRGRQCAVEHHTYVQRARAILATALRTPLMERRLSGLLAIIAGSQGIQQRMLTTRPNLLLLSWLDPGMFLKILADKQQGRK